MPGSNPQQSLDLLGESHIMQNILIDLMGLLNTSGELSQSYRTWCAGTPKVGPIGVVCELLLSLALLGADPYEVIFFLGIIMHKSLVNKWICKKI